MTGREKAQIERLIAALEEYTQDSPKRRRRRLWQNLLYGVCRGLGFTLGFSVLGALLLGALRALLVGNIPLIGGFLAEVIHAIEARM